MAAFVVAGSQNNRFFTVGTYASAGFTGSSVISLAPGFSGGCAVAAAGNIVAVGNTNGAQIVFYDMTKLSAPVRRSSLTTTFAGIGAIAADGTYVLAGELDGSRIVLIDVSNLAQPRVVSTLTTNVHSVGSIGLQSLSGQFSMHAVVGGPNSPTITVVNYINLTAPQQQIFNPGFGGGYTVDIAHGTAVAGNMNGQQVACFPLINGITSPPPALNVLPGISSVSNTGLSVCGSSNTTEIALVDFQSSSPIISKMNSGLSGGATVLLVPGSIFAGAVLGSKVAHFSYDGGLRATGSMDFLLASISTLAAGSTPL